MRVDPAGSSPAAEAGGAETHAAAGADARAAGDATGLETRLAFGLTAATLLFFLQAFSALLASEFGLAYDAVYPSLDAGLLALAVLPAAALLAPALPFSLWLNRRIAIASFAGAAALARIVVCVPAPRVRLLAATVVVACGAVFLGKVVGYVGRRAVAAAAATALTLDPLLRFAGWSWDPTLRPSWLPFQAALSLSVIALAVAWSRAARAAEPAHAGDHGLERRAGGVRLRGAIAAACVLFLDQAVLGRPEAIARLAGGSYEIAAAATVVGGAAAAALLLAAPDPVGWERIVTLILGVFAAAVSVLVTTGAVRDGAALALAAVAHAGALLLLDRALVPAGGRRRGWRLATGLLVLLALHAIYGLTFFYAQTWPALAGMAPTVLIGAGLLLAASLALTPRPLPAPARLGRPAVAAAGVVAYALAAALLAARSPAPVPPRSNEVLHVGTYNIHYGFSGDWRYDPEAIARTIEAADVDVVALQQAPAGVPALYGTDLALWLGRRLGMRDYLAPRVNGLLGEAVLAREPPRSSTLGELSAAGEPAGIATLVFERSGRLIALHATHLSSLRGARLEQLTPLIAAVAHGEAAVLLGDLNAEPGSVVSIALDQAGFRDAFATAGATPAPTAPADRPTARIDWIWVRGLDASDAAVLPSAASDHRLVRATVRPTG